MSIAQQLEEAAGPSPEIEKAFEAFMAHAKKKAHDKLGYSKGRKYWRIYTEDRAGGKSAYGFFNPETGDLLKPDGWKRPAKGPRGNVMDKGSWDRAAGVYGIGGMVKP